MIEFRLVPMTKEYAQQIFAWRYDVPYDFYNPGGNETDFVAAFLNPEYHYHAVINADGTLIAYRCFGEDARVPGGNYTADALDMGGGLRPDLTGRGLGPQVMRAAMKFAQEVFAPRAFRVTVAEWNSRALKACAKAGYQPTGRFENPAGVRFVVLMRASLDSPDGASL